MEDNPKVQIKGIRDGLLITLADGPWEEVRQALLDQLDHQADFLRGGRIALDVGNRALKAAEMGKLRKEIGARELTLWAVLSDSPTTEQTAQTLGLAIQIARPKPEHLVQPTEVTNPPGEAAILVRRTLRSGNSVQHSGHIVVIGDVNPGAEIVAGGDVLVWGRLRGMVHAGAQGNPQAVVCALDLSPTQLRIADKIALAPKRRGKPQPEMACLIENQVVAQPWDPKREKI